MTPLRTFLCLLPIFLSVCACAPFPGERQEAAAVGGKLTLDGEPAPGVRLMAYPAGSLSLDGPAPFVSKPADPEGRFRLELPPGDYFLLARGEGLFAYYGRNPVTASQGEELAVNLGLVPAAATGAGGGETFIGAGVAGRLVHEGRPVSGATVYVYTDLADDLKGMGYLMAGPTDAEGRFEAELPAGTYYLLARLRQGGKGFGPLGPGDLIGYFPGNPLTLAEGDLRRLVIPAWQVPERAGEFAGTLFGGTAIRGVVRDTRGQPVAGVRAVLYTDSRMLDRPLYVSSPTGPDGSFVLSLPRGGTYYLGARDTLGGAPGPGELYGTYDGTPDHALTLESGRTLEGVEIVVEEMW